VFAAFAIALPVFDAPIVFRTVVPSKPVCKGVKPKAFVAAPVAAPVAAAVPAPVAPAVAAPVAPAAPAAPPMLANVVLAGALADKAVPAAAAAAAGVIPAAIFAATGSVAIAKSPSPAAAVGTKGVLAKSIAPLAPVVPTLDREVPASSDHPMHLLIDCPRKAKRLL